MLQLNLKPEVEVKFKKIVEKYQGDYNNLLYDIIDYHIAELKRGMKNIEMDLTYFENRYAMTTREFYDKFEKGELGDENSDFFQWSGEYEIWMEHKKYLEELR